MLIRSIGGFAVGITFFATVLATGARADQVVADDLIVQGSLCTGFDCVNGETFPHDLIRLKENNLRIAFQDISDPDALPGGDWQITANDSANGGLNRFSFEDLTSATVPFWLGGAAPTNTLYLTSDGRLGLGTEAPEAALHVAGSVRIDGDLLVTGGLRAGRVAAAALASDGTATVAFATPQSRDYAITLSPVLAKPKPNAQVVVVSHDQNGFTFAVSGKSRDYVEVVWTTRWVGEF